jgi:HAD superfamily hydrolase (TIGR01549 family)
MNPLSRKPIHAILFDLDDTLWPIVPVILRAEALLHEWLQEHAPAVPQRFSIAALRARRSELIKAQPHLAIDLWALRHTGLTEAFQACGEACDKVDQAMALFAHARNQVTLYDDVAVCLPRLARHVSLGSLTNGGADLQAIGLAHHFKVSVAAHQLGRAKPDPAVFHAACEALALAPENVVYVGDDLALDVEGAQRAGLRGIWLNRTGTAASANHSHIRPDANLTSLHELENWLLATDNSDEVTGAARLRSLE